MDQIRAGFADLGRLFPLPPEARVEAACYGGVAGEWVWHTEGGRAAEAAGDGRPILVFFHGGAYVFGSPATHRELAWRLARATGGRCFLPDYRLAPEHPFPAAADDAEAVYRGLLAAGARALRVVLAGDSAGGALALVAALGARREGLALPAGLALLSPWVDLEGLGESMETNAARDPLIQRPLLLRMARLYLAGAEAWAPRAAPLYADLSALPPMLIQVGEAETLLDDAVRLAQRAAEAGNAMQLRRWSGMFHSWQLFSRFLAEGQGAVDEVADFVSGSLGPPRGSEPAAQG